MIPGTQLVPQKTLQEGLCPTAVCAHAWGGVTVLPWEAGRGSVGVPGAPREGSMLPWCRQQFPAPPHHSLYLSEPWFPYRTMVSAFRARRVTAGVKTPWARDVLLTTPEPQQKQQTELLRAEAPPVSSPCGRKRPKGGLSKRPEAGSCSEHPNVTLLGWRSRVVL